MTKDTNTPDPQLSNVPEFSVTELSTSVKKTMETTFGRVRVRGELGRITIPGSGHLYTNLKDDNSTIDAVCWKGSMRKLSIRPEEGLEVICTGRLTTYPKSSKYQLVIESMELAGEGALLKMLEDRRKKLAAEGLFSDARKQDLPYIPETIGVITSPTGAVIRDILHRLSDRFPVWPVLVQGDGAANQITAAIEGFNTLDQQGHKKPDLIIVARGGGSLEDLMPFNEENVVRAAASSKIPLISAVGHETDTTLIDYAAIDQQNRMHSGVTRLITEQTHKLESATRGLGDPSKLLEIKTQTLDHITDKITRIFDQYTTKKTSNLRELTARLRTPNERLTAAADTLTRWSEQLHTSGSKITEHPQTALEKTTHTLTPTILDYIKYKDLKLTATQQLLEAYSFKNTLNRGFTVLRDTSGNIITTPDSAQTAGHIQIEFKDNKKLNATIQSKKQTDQGSLF